MAHDIRALERLAPSADLSPLERPRPAESTPKSAICTSEVHIADTSDRPRRSIVPGLALVAAAVAAAFAANAALPSLSPLVLSVVLGAVAANLGLVPDAARPGTTFAAKRLLRAGVVLLGLQLAVGDMLALGGTGLALVVVVVTATFFGTQWVGRRLGLSPGLALLVATGCSICGASAVAAMEGVSDADEEDVAYAVALVTLCGSLCIALLPVLQGPLGLDAAAFGTWTGASVHDVGQVVATASSAGAVALSAAVVVKLTRVVLLAPLVAGVSLARRRQGQATPARGTRRPPLLPLFVAGFLASVALSSTGIVPDGWLANAKTLEKVLLSAALFGLGTGVQLSKLRRIGGRPLVLGLGAWALVAVVSYAGVLVIGV